MTTKEKTLRNLQHTYCRLKISNISGVGVFAVRDIKKGVNPFSGVKEKKWIKHHVKDLAKLDKAVMGMINDFFVIEKDSSVYIPEDGLNGINVSFFVNDSKNPNLAVVGDGEKSEISFKTTRNIKRGEELTVAYKTYDYKYQ